MSEQLNRIDRRDPEQITFAVRMGGRIQRTTLDRLLELLAMKTPYPHWITVEVQTSALLKTIDNEADALETIRRLEQAPTKTPDECTCHLDCGEDSHSGSWHQHEDDPCPCHPDAPMVG